MNGYGCKKCNFSKISKGEKGIIEFLKKNNIEFIHQHKFNDCIGISNKLPFDFYLPKYNTCIEFDGRQHFESVKKFGGEKNFLDIQRTDNIKNKYCLNNNIKLIRISYLNLKNINEILEKEFNCIE